MSLETNLLLKEKIYLKNCRFAGLRKLALITIALLFVSFAIYNYQYTEHVIIEQFEIFNESDENDDNDDIVRKLSNKLTATFEYRHNHVENKCAQLGINLEKGDKRYSLNSWEFLISDKYHLVYCNIFKAASSSWLYNFNLLAGYTPEILDNASKSPVALAREVYPRPSYHTLSAALKNHISFMIVRHPFERLVSAYVDKFIKSGSKPYFIKMGDDMIEESRLKWSRLYKPNETSNILPQFMDRITEAADRGATLPPTFEEFIRFVLCQAKANRRLNEHWIPMTRFCTPCFAHFDIIMKFETLEEEQEYFLKLARLDNIIKPIWRNPTNREHKNISKEYFSQLSVEQIIELAELYKYDFELFQYSPDNYFEFGRHNYTTLPCFSSRFTTFNDYKKENDHGKNRNDDPKNAEKSIHNHRNDYNKRKYSDHDYYKDNKILI